MRSHAKASSVGSNSDRGKSRRSLRRSGKLGGLLVALVAAACLLPGSASAIEFRTLTESFGSDGTEGTSFSNVGPLAFDQSSNRLYALNQATHEIHGFDAGTPGSHTPLGGSFPLSEPAAGFPAEGFYDDLTVDSSSHDIYFSNAGSNKLFGYDQSGAPLPGFPISGSNFVCSVQVDSVGNVWVAERGDERINKYSSSGVLLTTIGLYGFEPCRFVIDNEDNLIATGFFGGPVVKFAAASEYQTSKSTVVDPEFSYGLTLDHSTGELYVVHLESVSVYDEEGTFLYEFGTGRFFYGELGGIAIDEATEKVYVAETEFGKIRVFGAPLSLPKTTTEGTDAIAATGATVHGTINPRGQVVEDCHFEVIPASKFLVTKYENVTPAEKFPCEPAAGSIPVDANPHAVSANVAGLEPATTYHYRLVAKNAVGEGKGFDRQFTTGPASPLVEEQSVEAVGTTEATVLAKINPRGGETTYHLEYGTTGAYGQSSAESAPFGFASDKSKHPVSVHLSGLQPGTAYHFRFVATNEVDTTKGTDTSFATYSAIPSFSSCSNDEFRTGPGSRLPDCRAYEQATPVDKHGANAQIRPSAVSASGDRVTFSANGGLPVSGGLSDLFPFLTMRGPDGWSTDGFLPPTQPGFRPRILGVSEDLSAALVLGEGPGGVGKQLLLRDSDTAAFEPTGIAAPEFQALDFIGFAADSSHVFFLSETQLLPSAQEGKPNLYDYDHGTLTLASRVPAGSATSCDDEAGPVCVVPPEGTTYGVGAHKISRDGSRVFFTADLAKRAFESGRIYMREDGARTTWISASQRTTPDPGGEKPARLVGITPDGSKAFFLSCEKLTDDSTAHSSGASSCESNPFNPVEGRDLYSYDVKTGELTDLTVDSNAGDALGAAVGRIFGISDDGSRVYFTATGVLADDASPCSPGGGNLGCNLYVYHDGVTKFIAVLSSEAQVFDDRRVAADGSALIFSSRESLTGYDSSPAQAGQCTGPCPEYFRYSAADEELRCLTCVPTGTRPTGKPNLGSIGLALGVGLNNGIPRNLSADGNRFFFESPDAMVSGDTNGVRDVYEWEAKGTGTCESESQNGGCLYLISSGTDPLDSTFLGASKNGDHVFFFTSQPLVPTDQDQLRDVYDAGVAAGLAAQHTLAPPTCSSTACQANPPPPPDPTLSSASFQGPGNAHPRPKARKCPTGTRKVRRKGKVSCKKAPKQHKRHDNRGGSK